jgi:tryptophanyl-tRNA synthetase
MFPLLPRGLPRRGGSGWRGGCFLAGKRILSGMRPTGKLHLGNLHGALYNWVALQNNGEYECFYFVADWHALTSDYAATENIRENSIAMVIDWLSAGLEPDKSTIFVQSSIKEHAELFLLLSMITPLAWLERNPTYKEIKDELAQKDLSTFGFLGYPVLQAADIIMYKAFGVPVGVDQLPHVELTREIARRFNFLYGETFPIPEPLLAEVPKLLGMDGRKMSKSYDNAIFMGDQGDDLKKKVAAMFTDPQRQRKSDPGRPELCNVYTLHGIYSALDDVVEIAAACRSAAIGCTECKKRLAAAIAAGMRPVHEKREHYLSHPEEVRAIIEDGNLRAGRIAASTLVEVREAMKIKHELRD